ncbi:MAG: YfiM family protein [Bacteroidetes bacterium]|nr:YfiM family protein [Bacteroidota bacterium]MBU1796768.1 YfiM family protein [Bacteroidota bacterium]
MSKYITNRIVLSIIVFLFNINLFAQSDTLNHFYPKNKFLTHLGEMQQIYQISKIDPLKKEINYPILSGVGLSYAFLIYEINDYYKNTWWKKNSDYTYDGTFHIVNDWNYALWLDKFGHAYGTALISHFFSAGFQAANVNPELATWLGVIGGFGMQLYVEIQDGYAPLNSDGEPKWGFSPGDAVSDFLGASYFVAKYYYPYLNNFQLRVSYFPSEAFRNGMKPDNNISDDYDGQKMWLAFRMKNLLPNNLAEYWPSFLMLSAGYSVSGIGEYATGNKLTPSYFIAFDLDASEIPLHGEFWEFIKNTLNYLHFPLPGIKISNDGISFLLFAY